MTDYSILSLAKNALNGQAGWAPAWRKPDPKPEYDVVIVGGGGHGLATAHYLAKDHGITNVAVLEKNLIGSGNVGRNTTLVRSNYMLDRTLPFYEHSLKLWEGLSHDLNYNVMFSSRGIINLAHSPGQLDVFRRRANSMLLNGVKAEILGTDQIAEKVPALDVSNAARFPILGGLYQARGGTARHDAVAWGFARSADRRGVDIIEQCEVKGFLKKDGRVVGVSTSRGEIRAKKTAIVVAGSSSHVLQQAGLNNLPIESHVLQAFVSEGLKPVLDVAITFGAGHLYVSQSDKGGLVFGGDLDGYNSYAQRGNLPVAEDVATALLAMFPAFAKVRVLRSWGGIMDMSMDGQPIIDVGPVPGLYINCGWCYEGFKATPASGYTFAWTIANDAPHELNAPFSLSRFQNGYVLDEKGRGPFPGHH
ncbi:MAG: sarcosine oxidase subunit beta family protein [Alphaproteobacteria bacterium]